MPGYPYSTQPGAQGTGAPPFQQPGYQPTTGNRQPSPTAAQDMIQKLLTQPRPGGAAGQAAQPQMGQTIGGGIAGVASTADEDGIKVYNDHTNYKEWEFIYDYTKDKGPVGAQTGANGTPAADLGTAPGAQPGQTPGTAPNQPGTSPFGTQQPGGFGQPNQPASRHARTTAAPVTYTAAFCRLRKYSAVWRKPSSSPTRGSQPSTRFAFEMSGRRCLGSSSGSGL
jgi:hypothetical protein